MSDQIAATKAAFVEELTRFHSLRGVTLKIPKFNRAPLDLEKLWHAVRKSGGSSRVCEMKHWAQIGRIFGGTSADKNVSNNIKRAFTRWLLPYERTFYPDEAMLSGEHSVSSTPRRKRQPTPHSNSHEKKSRSMSFKKNEKNEANPKMTTTELEQNLPAVMSMTQPTTPANSIPQTQRSYVSIPHSTESKYCIILLPTTTAQDLSGQGEKDMQVDEPHAHPSSDPSLESTGAVQAMSGAAAKSGTAQDSDAAVNQAPTAGTGQLTLSLLLNHNNDGGSPSEVQQLISNIPVLLKQEAHEDPTSANVAQGVTTTAARELTEDGMREGQASITNVSCSGLLCLIDSGSAQNPPPPPPPQREMEDNAIIASKTT